MIKSIQQIIADRDELWRQRIEAFGRELRQRFEQFASDIDGLGALEGEISEDDAPGLWADFVALATLGVKFDPQFSAMMRRLQRSLVAVIVEDDTPEEDGSDEALFDDGSIRRPVCSTPATATLPPLRPRGPKDHAFTIPGHKPTKKENRL